MLHEPPGVAEVRCRIRASQAVHRLDAAAAAAWDLAADSWRDLDHCASETDAMARVNDTARRAVECAELLADPRACIGNSRSDILVAIQAASIAHAQVALWSGRDPRHATTSAHALLRID